MRDARRFGAYADAIIELDKIWGRAAVGLELTKGYFEGYAVTADSMAARLAISDDTARRLLERLVSEAKVWVSMEKGRRSYTAVTEWAELTVKICLPAERYHPQLAAE